MPLGARIAARSRLSTFSASTFLSAKLRMDSLGEELRVLYVAMTRAKSHLYLTEVCNGKSMFLQEMEELIDVKGGEGIE